MIGGPDPDMSEALYEAYLDFFAPLAKAMEVAHASRDEVALRWDAMPDAASSIAATQLTDVLRRLETCAIDAG